MIELYHSVSARSFRVLWLLEELGLPYRLKMLPFPPRAMARSFLELNPLGTVPLLIDGEQRLTESSAICQFLCDFVPGTSLKVAPGDAAYAAYLNWLFMSDATLTFPLTLVLRYTHFEPPERRQPQVAQDYARWFLGRLRAVESATSQHEYLCAERFTAADIAVSYALMLSEFLDMSSQWGPATQAYWQRLRARPAFVRSLAIERQAAIEQGVDPTPSPLLRP
ncbi:glutathione S-transferase family protein [Diaphorobacter aerolatus]|uniref:Glutathione S-transferase family protein n=1 Tax=Diaphorobacter aerolatus TaxID=1288495 RepID=A0A7H0GP88_9BURK|nr:glutathione S-transferase family protein [Diaphorobacter aerolatus]QNP50104.1 glutathione S-transferase family protein [Diaphorobacter aerolatus]